MRSLVVLLCVGVVHAADPMPSPWEDYADVLARVKGGETIRIAVGVPATGEYVAVGGVPSEVKHGLWRCYKDGNRAAMVLESAAGTHYPKNTPSNYVKRWTHPPDLRTHLMSSMHGFSADTIRNMSISDMERLHDDDHDRKSGRTATRQVAPPRQPVMPYTLAPNLQYYLRPGGIGGPSYCPPGQP